MIESSELGKQFNEFWAVESLSLTVRPGQVLALLGQNGAGKTTTVRMLTALLAPTRGWARVSGYDVVKQGRDVRASAGGLTGQHRLFMWFGGGLTPSHRRVFQMDASETGIGARFDPRTFRPVIGRTHLGHGPGVGPA